jgi:muconolactone delta-isomerase
MDFLVEFQLEIPTGTSASEIAAREEAEASAAARLAREGRLVRVWRRSVGPDGTSVIGLYRADSEAELDRLLGELPLFDWMQVAVTALQPHPNDPAASGRDGLPNPRLTLVYRLEATLGQAEDLGNVAPGHRRIVPLSGGTFTGPEISGTLLPGASADWQVVLPDGTALGDIRYTLETLTGDLLYVRSRSVRHGTAEVLARLARGEDVDPGEYTFRASTRIETAARDLDWLNKGVFISVGGREAAAVIYETYLVA